MAFRKAGTCSGGMIPEETFSECHSLTAFAVPEGVTNIRWSAFYHCDSLVRVQIPPSVRPIDSTAFVACPQVTLCGRENSAAHRYALAQGLGWQTETET